MSLLKKIPITFKGELHDVLLLNFSIDPQEVRASLPSSFEPKLFDGRALISMVSVNLKKMRPKGFPGFLGFNYHHLAFRLLIKDKHWNGSESDKGIFFLRSFTNKPLVALAGKWMTEYRLESANLHRQGNSLKMRKGDQKIEFAVGERTDPDENAKKFLPAVGAIDRAYALYGNQIRFTQVIRKEWPLVSLKMGTFSNTFFDSCRLETIFAVPKVIHYTWKAPKAVTE